ncbi:hypothetical protein DPMN_021927 [Dreissena polymorpha]|uniref:Uncharacterized protein n=1 Tax=Dreissena polymorpha TaxID=45954 RepID=A0A9D4NPX4_DREPO|nr:hypothetical protein DPMN_021927 [Dreissena polymorpha]
MQEVPRGDVRRYIGIGFTTLWGRENCTMGSQQSQSPESHTAKSLCHPRAPRTCCICEQYGRKRQSKETAT